MKWNLIIDVAECENCNNCVVATKDELVGNDFSGYSAPHPAQGNGVVRIERHVRGSGHHTAAAYVPRMCNHCDEAPCVNAGGGAVKKRDDGIVLFDPVACKGRRDLVDACPYDAIVWNEALQLPQTWFFDAHLLDAGWKAPRLVPVCPTAAIEAVKVDDASMQRRIADEGLRPLKPELGTRPRVWYRHLHRADSCFVAGSVVTGGTGPVECVEGALVELQIQGRRMETRTDPFGDFRIDGLARDSGPWRLDISQSEFGSASREGVVGSDSVVLEDIALTGQARACPE